MSKLFAWPDSARFGKILPKNKIYEHGGLPRKMQARFVEQIDQIVWAYKLAPETINLQATAAVSEIQIFRLRLRTRDISPETLTAIDRAIAFPIIFELRYADQARVMAAHKRPSDADGSKWVVSAHLAGQWVAADSERQSLPIALDMALLYEALLSPLLPDPGNEAAWDERPDLRAQMERIQQIKASETQIAKIEARLSREKQFNRKVEINAELREARASYQAMTGKPSGDPSGEE